MEKMLKLRPEIENNWELENSSCKDLSNKSRKRAQDDAYGTRPNSHGRPNFA